MIQENIDSSQQDDEVADIEDHAASDAELFVRDTQEGAQSPRCVSRVESEPWAALDNQVSSEKAHTPLRIYFNVLSFLCSISHV